MRKLRFHEKKLLRKVDFISWKLDNNLHSISVMRRFHIQRRDDYSVYYKLAKQFHDTMKQLQKIDNNDPFRAESTASLLDRAYNLGLIPVKNNLGDIEKINASTFCKRRLPVLMVQYKMSENLKTATTFVQQGHVRVGPDIVTDPAFLVPRNLEDFITWVDTSAIKKKVEEYNEGKDDFDLM